MSIESLIALFGFVLAATSTPGPNNLMVLVSGANWGLRRTMPHIVGIALGFPAMIIAVGLGLESVFEAYPTIHDVLRYLALIYILYLAWRMVRAGRPDTSTRRSRPLNVIEAMAFQWVNPKAWALMFGAIALFTTSAGNPWFEVGAIALAFGLVCLPNGVVWCLFGKAIARFLANDRRRQVFNIVMAVLLIASVVPVLFTS